MKAILILITGLLTSIATNAQLSQTARTELPLPSDFSNYQVWPQPDSSVMVFRSDPAYRRNLEPFTIYRLDSALNLTWQTPVSVPRGSHFLQAATEKQVTYLLFQGSKATEIHLVILNNRFGHQQVSTYRFPENSTFLLANFSVLDGYLFLAGHQNDRLTLLHLNPQEKELIKLPAIYEQGSALTEFLTDTAAKRMEFVLAESNGRRARLQVKRLAPDGHLLSLNFINSPDRNFLAARLAPGDSSRKLVIGSYSLRDLRYAQGFFTGPLTLQPGEKFQYHDFTTFTHYFDYLKPGRQLRLHQKIARYKLTQKIFPLRQRILLHAVRPYLDGYLMVGELYYPHYSGDANNRIFDGFQHVLAIAAAFDKNGNLLWENSFPLQDQRFYDLKETVTVGISGEKVWLAYADKTKIRYKEIKGVETTPNDTFSELLNPREKLLRTESDGILNWYQHFFLTYGTQEIRGSRGSRSVFYLSKLSAQK